MECNKRVTEAFLNVVVEAKTNGAFRDELIINERCLFLLFLNGYIEDI